MPKRARTLAPPTAEGGEPVTPPGQRELAAASPEGFAGWKEDEEVQLQYEGPQAPDPERLAIEVRVVYLGHKKYHSIPRPGGLIRHLRDDATEFSVPAPKQTEGSITYNFDRVDERGRSRGTVNHPQPDGSIRQLPVVRRTRDDHPFAICLHIEHAAWFLEKTDAEGNREYDLRAPAAMIQKIKAYIERRQRFARVDPDSPENVLKAIPAAQAWERLGGPIGESA